MIFLTSKSVYKHQNNESGEINVQISEKRNEKHQKHNSFQNGDKMAAARAEIQELHDVIHKGLSL